MVYVNPQLNSSSGSSRSSAEAFTDSEKLLSILEEFDKARDKEEKLYQYRELQGLRDASKFKREVSLNAMLSSAGYDTVRHAQAYEESSEAYAIYDGLISELANVLGSK